MDFILRLKEFYVLEMFQLKLYESQMGSFQNEYIEHAYQRIIELERHHVDYYKETLHQHGEEVPYFSGSLTALAGRFLGGTLLDLSTAENRYKLGVAVEKKAIEMYRAFVMEAFEYPDICRRLWHNMVDEEFTFYGLKIILNMLRPRWNQLN